MTYAILINNCFRAGHWPTCAHNGLQLCLGPNQVSRVRVLVLQPISASIGFDHDLCLVMKFVYMR